MPSRMVQSPPSTIGNAPLVEDDADGVSELGRVVAQPVGIEQAGGGVDGRVEGRGSQSGAAPGAQPLGESGREQGLDPGGAHAQVGGRFDDRTGRHLRPPYRDDRHSANRLDCGSAAMARVWLPTDVLPGITLEPPPRSNSALRTPHEPPRASPPALAQCPATGEFVMGAVLWGSLDGMQRVKIEVEVSQESS
jgi:hypothetical protein